MLPKDQVALAMREAVSRPQLERKPIPIINASLNEADARQVHDAVTRAYAGVFHFNALAISRLVPQGGLVLDLASGSAEFLAYLATCRPDLQIIGVEENKDYLALGQTYLSEQGLTERVLLNEGSPTFFAERIPSRIDMITSVFGLHTLQNSGDLVKCLHESLLVRIRCGCAFWVFDFARPNLLKTAEDFPATLTPVSPIQFKRQVRNSLMASYTYDEVEEAFGKVSFGTVRHALSTNLKLFQAHWIEREDNVVAGNEALWIEPRLPAPAVSQFKDISSIFPKVPLPKHLK